MPAQVWGSARQCVSSLFPCHVPAANLQLIPYEVEGRTRRIRRIVLIFPRDLAHGVIDIRLTRLVAPRLFDRLGRRAADADSDELITHPISDSPVTVVTPVTNETR